MTTNPLQSYYSPELSGTWVNAVCLCVALLGFWVVVSSLFLELPELPSSLSVADYSNSADVAAEDWVVALEVSSENSSECCLEVDCSDFQDCSLSCVSSCPAPQLAVLENLLYRDLSLGAGAVSAIAEAAFVQATAHALFRPPIV